MAQTHARASLYFYLNWGLRAARPAESQLLIKVCSGEIPKPYQEKKIVNLFNLKLKLLSLLYPLPIYVIRAKERVNSIKKNLDKHLD